MDIPKTQKALIYDAPGTISIKEVEIPVPDPGPGEVLIRLQVKPNLLILSAILVNILNHRTHSGVCHSDLGVMTNSVGSSPSRTAYLEESHYRTD